MARKARSIALKRWVALVFTLSSIGLVTAQEWTKPQVVEEFTSGGFAIDLVPIDDSLLDDWVLPDGQEITSENLEQIQRCLAHGFATSGQDYYVSGSDYYVSGSVGGKMLGIPFDVTGPNDVPIPVYPSTVAGFQPEYVGLETQITLQGVLSQLAQAPGRDVAIIVADDFAGGHFTIPDAVFGFKDNDLDRTALEALVDSGELSHGAMVLHNLNALIATSDMFEGTDSRVMYPEAGVFQWVSSTTGKRLVVRGADLSVGDPQTPITSAVIAERIAGAINGWSDQVSSDIPPPSDFVVNMSWVLLPCATVEAFLKAKDFFPTYGDYILALEPPPNSSLWAAKQAYPSPGPDGRGFIEAMIALLSWAPDTDPVYELTHTDVDLDREGQDSRIAFVAAAGNFLLPYQMLPAGWPYVIGVGSPNPGWSSRGVHPPPFSNYFADLVAPGAWYHLQPELDWEPNVTGGELSYAGTSYSAPIVSLVAALDIASNSHCTAVWPPSGRPGLVPETHVREEFWLADALLTSPLYCTQPVISNP